MAPTFFQADDLSVFLEDFGVDVDLNGTTVKALLDIETEEILDSDAPSPVTGEGVVFTIETGSIPAVAGSVLTSEGVTYKVRDPRKIGDGAFTRLLCEVVT